MFGGGMGRIMRTMAMYYLVTQAMQWWRGPSSETDETASTTALPEVGRLRSRGLVPLPNEPETFVHYTRWSDASCVKCPVFICTHQALRAGTEFETFAKAFPEASIVAVDLPGHGASDPSVSDPGEAVVTVAKALQLETIAAVIGSGKLGAEAALAFTTEWSATHAVPVSALVLSAPEYSAPSPGSEDEVSAWAA